MKKILSVILCCCLLLSGGALTVNASIDRASSPIIEEQAAEEMMEFISVDNVTGEVCLAELSYTPEARAMSNGTIGNVHPGYVPESLMVANDGANQRGIVGDDGRVLIPYTQMFPYSAICCLKAEYIGTDGKPYISWGTAWMIGPNIAVTAAHCVYDRDSGSNMTITGFWPGKMGVLNPFGNGSVINVKYPAKFITNDETKYDWAVLTLADADLGYDTGWFGFGWTSSYPEEENYIITGYPCDTENGVWERFMYTASGIISGGTTPAENALEGTTLFHKIDTGSGQSGAPMYDSAYTVYGIHQKKFSNTTNTAVRITLAIFTCLERIEEITEITDVVFP